MSHPMRNALSIDLEDWFHAELVRSLVQPQPAGQGPERRVVWAVEPILALLRRYDVHATFFVVGDVMRHHPDLIRRIHGEGHEIGCHGWSHRTLWGLDPERFSWELDEFDRDASRVLDPQEIVGFRAPTFSLDERTAWALGILRAHGFRYDSSLFPMHTGLYGVDDCPPEPYRPTAQELTRDHAFESESQLVEFPMTVYRAAGFRIPVSGGFYMRVMPLPIWRYLLSRFNAQGHPFVTYLHPWEGDPQTPRVKGLSPLKRFVTYYNLNMTLRKLEVLLGTFDFAPLKEVLEIAGGRLPRATEGVDA
jgi:polysaccharide deacetylase family protein (PEP-CTERM system associated)